MQNLFDHRKRARREVPFGDQSHNLVALAPPSPS
jgi:hypothetical protein